jgi:FAD/FMN-containing dehydrogenase
MGLTGLITTARIRLLKVASPDVRQRTIRFGHIDDFFAAVERVDQQHEYSVAWIDQLARGAQFGRGVLMGADHCQEPTGYSRKTRPLLTVPFTPPMSLLNRPTLKAFNELFFRKERPGEVIKQISWKSYFYPLDVITHWNRLYGPGGLYQHQSVYPEHAALQTTRRLLETSQNHGHASFLTVLKRFGDRPSPGFLSFPQPGYTLTLDFANRGDDTLALLSALDEIVLEAGGRVNPYKDGRMSASAFRASFPQWHRLESFRDPMMLSDFWRRTALSNS